MKNSEVYKWFGDFFEKRGFNKHGRYIVKMGSISAFSFSFECTNTNSVYFRYAFLPLFVPADYIDYAYGGRLEQIASGHTSLTMPYETESSIKEWVELVKTTVDSHILPVFKEIENPYILQSLLLNGRPIIFKGSILRHYKLLIYLCVMLGDDPKSVSQLFNKAIKEINKSHISDSLKLGFEAEIKDLISIKFNSADERIIYFQRIIDITKQKIFGL